MRVKTLQDRRWRNLSRIAVDLNRHMFQSIVIEARNEEMATDYELRKRYEKL